MQRIPRNTILHENPSSNGPIGGPGNSRQGESVCTSCSQHEVLAQRCWFSQRDNLQPRKASILIGGGILYFSPSTWFLAINSRLHTYKTRFCCICGGIRVRGVEILTKFKFSFLSAKARMDLGNTPLVMICNLWGGRWGRLPSSYHLGEAGGGDGSLAASESTALPPESCVPDSCNDGARLCRRPTRPGSLRGEENMMFRHRHWDHSGFGNAL